MEATGLAVGIAGLLSSLGTCRKGLDTWRAIRTADEDVSTLFSQLEDFKVLAKLIDQNCGPPSDNVDHGAGTANANPVQGTVRHLVTRCRESLNELNDLIASLKRKDKAIVGSPATDVSNKDNFKRLKSYFKGDSLSKMCTILQERKADLSLALLALSL